MCSSEHRFAGSPFLPAFPLLLYFYASPLASPRISSEGGLGDTRGKGLNLHHGAPLASGLLIVAWGTRL